MTLNKQGAIPLYEKIANSIRHQIESGELQQGGALPSEERLCEDFDVSRITIRRAVQELATSGFVEKVQGKGTFVQYKRIEQELLSLSGFTETFKRKGLNLHHKIVAEEKCLADRATQKALNISSNDSVLKITRIHYLDDVPFNLDVSYFPVELFKDLFQYLPDDYSLYKVFKEHYHIEPKHAERTITISLASEMESELLHCKHSEPLFMMDKVVYDEAMKPLHRSVLLSPSSRVCLKMSH